MANHEQKKSYLDILAVFHYVNGGLTALVALAAIAFMGIGLGAASEWGSNFQPEPTCALIAVIFFILVFVGGYAVLNLLAGRALHTRKSRILILITSGVNCLNIPFGTLLGIFTFVMMLDPQVEWIFRHGDDAPAQMGPGGPEGSGYHQPAPPAETSYETMHSDAPPAEAPPRDTTPRDEP